MAEGKWETLALSKYFDALQPVFDVLNSLLGGLLAGLEPIQGILEAIELFLLEIDPTAFDFTLGINLLGTIEILHHYPYQDYQALKFSTWASAIQSSFTDSYVADYPPPYEMTVLIIEAEAVGLLMELVDNMTDVLELSRSFTDDFPENLDRGLVHIRTPKPYQTKDLVPIIGEFADYLSSSITIRGSGPVGAMRNAILFKIQGITRKLDTIERIALQIKALEDLPQVKKLSFEITSPSQVAGCITSASNGPSSSSYVAGSVIFSNIATMGATNTLLAADGDPLIFRPGDIV